MKIHEALSKIQSELVAPKGQFNAFGKYKYRSCEDILEAVKPLLAETKTVLTLTDEIVLIGNRFYVKATATLNLDLENVSVSAYARESEDKKGMDDSQITGATSSYARKYALNGLFCIDDTKDADSTNTHAKEATEAKKEALPVVSPTSLTPGVAVSIKDEVILLGKAKFKTPEDFQVWRVENDFHEKLHLCSNESLFKMKGMLKNAK